MVGQYKLTRMGFASYFTQETDADRIPVEFVSGNAMGFRRHILDDVGNYLFDARLKSYAEDLDLSIRLKNTKWGMVVRPQAVDARGIAVEVGQRHGHEATQRLVTGRFEDAQSL